MSTDYKWLSEPGKTMFLMKEDAAQFATATQGAHADSAYQKPAGGVPESDLSPDVQAQLAEIPNAEVTSKKVPIKLATDADQYPTAISVTEFVQEMMGNVTSSLQIPKPLDKESLLPAATPGAVYRITNMDVTSPGSRGEAWGSDDSTWLKIVFQDTSVDGLSITSVNGIYTVSQTWLTGIISQLITAHNAALDAHSALFAAKLEKFSGMIDGHLAVFADNELTDSGSGLSAFATALQGAKADTAIQVETDPTVPAWAKAKSKPLYTAIEVGAATAAQGAKADTALQKETDPTVPSWAKTINKPTYSASEVGAATAAQGAKADTAMQKMAVSGTAVLSGKSYGGKPSYLLNVTVTLSASNDSDGAYYTIPTYKSLIDCRGHVLNKGSYTRMPIPMCNDNGYFCHIRIDGGGQIWIRAKEANGAFNGSDCMLNIEYLQS